MSSPATPIAGIEVVLDIAEKYQEAMKRVHKLISDTQVEVGIRCEKGEGTQSDLDLAKFINKLLDCLVM